jgi:stearoyl-CoA desaturase (Delta-9 desaturase)
VSSSSLPKSSLQKTFQRIPQYLRQIWDADYKPEWVDGLQSTNKKMEFLYCFPFIFLHGGCLGLIWVGASWPAVLTAVAFYWVRMFALTGFYHRYFSHRTYKTNRFWQFMFGCLGMTAMQKGPLWWAAHHRIHHRESDQPADSHSPIQRGFVWSHIGWITSRQNLVTDFSQVKDLAKFPELMFLNRFDWLVPALMILAMYGLGVALENLLPGSGVNGMQMAVWGFFVSTTVLFHAVSSINSIAHCVGNRRYETTDQSRNNWLLAIITMGEGWHNNHHAYCGTVRQGFYWWEIDMTYYILWAMSKVGIIYDLHPVPKQAYQSVRLTSSTESADSCLAASRELASVS